MNLLIYPLRDLGCADGCLSQFFSLRLDQRIHSYHQIGSKLRFAEKPQSLDIQKEALEGFYMQHHSNLKFVL